MEKIVTHGLAGVKGLADKNNWHDFLTKGCYDPRLLLVVCAFIQDQNYFHTSLREIGRAHV